MLIKQNKIQNSYNQVKLSLYGHNLERTTENENSSIRIRGGITVSSSALECFWLITLEVLISVWVGGEVWEGVGEGIANTSFINCIFLIITLQQ